MAFTIPTFNLVCDIFDNASPPPLPGRIIAQECALKYPGRAIADVVLSTSPGWGNCWYLLLPKETDIRDIYCGVGEDYVEVPTGSGRIYRVYNVDDVGKGYPNEYRLALVQKTGTWPIPIP